MLLVLVLAVYMFVSCGEKKTDRDRKESEVPSTDTLNVSGKAETEAPVIYKIEIGGNDISLYNIVLGDKTEEVKLVGELLAERIKTIQVFRCFQCKESPQFAFRCLRYYTRPQVKKRLVRTGPDAGDIGIAIHQNDPESLGYFQTGKCRTGEAAGIASDFIGKPLIDCFEEGFGLRHRRRALRVQPDNNPLFLKQGQYDSFQQFPL